MMWDNDVDGQKRVVAARKRANVPKQVETTRLGHRYAFSFSLVLFPLIIYDLRLIPPSAGSRRVVDAIKTSPNESKRLIWAIGSHFHSIFFFSLLTIDLRY